MTKISVLQKENEMLQRRISELESSLAQNTSERELTEKILTESSARFHALFKTMAQGVVYQDASGKITLVNPAAERILGISKDEMLRRKSVDPRWNAVREDGSDFPREEHPAMVALRTGKPVNDVVMGVFNPQTKEYRWVLVNAVPEFHADETKPDRVFTTFADITAQKQAEQEMRANQRALKLFVEYAPAAIAMFDREMRYIAASRRYISDYQLRVQDLTGRSHYEIFPEIPERWKEIHRRCLAGAIEKADADPFPRADGSLDWVHWEIHPWYEAEGKIGGVILFSEVITQRKQAEAELRESEERFSTVFFTNPVSQSIITQSKSEILVVNDACCRLFGYSREELIGISTAQLTLWENPAERLAAVEELQKTGRLLSRETIIQTKTGEKRTVIAAIEPIAWRGIPCFISSTVDITERKKMEKLLRENERNYRELVQNANSAILRWDRNGNVTFINEFAQAFFGYKPDQIIGKPVNILVPETESTGNDLSTLVQNIVEHPEQFVNIVNENICHDGHRVWMAWTNKPTYDETGQISEILAVGVDITERKKIENELRRSNSDLEQFAYVASHDLQEPLRVISGMVQLLQKRYQGQLDEQANEYINHAVDAASRMQSLIRDLLTYSRVDRRGNPIEPISSQEALDMALGNLQMAIEETGAEIIHDELPMVLADRSQLTQLFQNLISNALKFRSEQTPKIMIHVTKLIDAYQFTVSDNGIGIEPKYFERIFQVFQRLHTRREYPGTGIGLALCKKIVERHGGKIWAESQPGGGSKFHFTLPIPKPPSEL